MTTPTFTFSKATKKAAKARIALDGISGSGKTYTALTIASALGQRIAVIDTEHRSASKYAGIFSFDTLPLESYDPRILVAALAAAGSEGYEVVIVDSLSHFWMGSDGMLEQVDRAGKRAGGHGMSGWKEMRPVERQMIEAMLAYPGHVIATMRVKNDWVEGEVRGKKAMVKVGTKAEQREGLEYEFDIVGTLSGDNELIVGKSRCPQLAGAVVAKPGLDFGHTIREWLDDGEAGAPTVADYRARAVAAADSLDVLRPLLAEVRAAGLLAAPVLDLAGAAVALGDLIVQLGRRAPAALPPADRALELPAEPVLAAEPRPAPAANGIRDWALHTDRTAEGIRAAAAKLVAEHPAVAAETVVNEHGDDEPLSGLLERRARELAPSAAPAEEQVERRRKRMFALFRDLGYDGDANRDQRHKVMSHALNREIASIKDLTPADVEAVIDALDARQQVQRRQARQGASA